MANLQTSAVSPVEIFIERAVRVSVVIPTLNEAENVGPLLEELSRSIAGRNDVEIIFADGDSVDGSAAVIEAWAERMPSQSLRVIQCGRGGGLSHDVMLAAEAAAGEVVVVMDADLSHPPSVVTALADKVLAGSCDMAVGSRYVRGGRTVGWPLRRKIASRAAAAMAWPIVDAADPMSGFFAVRREKLLELGGDAEGFKIALEVLVRGGEGLRVAEVPITFCDRSRGKSKMSGKQVRCYLQRLFALAGGAVSAGSAGKFLTVGLLGLALDLLLFQWMWVAGAGLGASHITSFLSATVVNFWLNSRWSFKSTRRPASSLDWRGYARFMVVCMMALFLRGAVLALAVDHWLWPAQAAIALGVAAAAVVNYFGNAFFVFPPAAAGAEGVRWRVGAIGVIVYIILLRLAYLPLPDLIPEEAYYWGYSRHMAMSFIDHPPMVAWLIWMGTAIFGNTEFGVRIGGFLCWFVTAGFGYGLARNLFGKAVAIRAVLLLSILPMFFMFGFFITPDSPLLAAWAGSLYFLERALLGERRRAWWSAGACVGIGLLSKYTIALLAPATLVFLLFHGPSRRWLRRYEPYAAFLLAAALFMPVIIWNAQHGWASFIFQSTRRLEEPRAFGLHILLLYALAIITPVGVLGVAEVFGSWFGRKPKARDEAAQRRNRMLMCMTLVPLSVFVLFSLTHEPKLSWTGPVWLALIPVLALNMPAMRDAKRQSGLTAYRALWPATAAVCTLLFGAGLHYLVLGLPMVGNVQAMRLPIGWKETAHAVQKLEDEVEDQTGSEPLIVGMDRYFIASEMTFYGSGANDAGNTTSRHLFGRDDMMYKTWMPAGQAEGRTVILVTFNRADLLAKSVYSHTTQLGEIGERDVMKHGRVVATLFYRVGQGYHV